MLGLSLLINLYGIESIGIPSLLAATVLPLFNVLAVATLEIFRRGQIEPGKVLVEIIKNPFIIGVLIGIIFSLLHIKLPFFVESTISSISSIALLVALIAMWASLDFKKAFEDRKNVLVVVPGKLILIPVIFIPPAIIFGFRYIGLTSLMVIFASPTAVATYTMVHQMDNDADMASSIIIVSTVLSCLSMFVWIVVLKQARFI